MPDAELQNIIRIARKHPAPAPIVSSDRRDHDEFVSIVLFSGLGLLVSLVAVLTGVQGYWY
jgi:hypothetical protein